MNRPRDNDQFEAVARRSKRAKLEALIFTAGTIATTVLTLGLFADLKLPKSQGE